MNKKWYNSKTVLTGIISILGAAAGVATNTLAIPAAIQIVEVALLGIFLRDAISTK